MDAHQPITEILQVDEDAHQTKVISVIGRIARGLHDARDVGVHGGEDVSVAHDSVLSYVSVWQL